MRLLARINQDKQPALSITLTASRITQHGVHAGDNFFSWQDYTFEKTIPFTALTWAELIDLEHIVAKGLADEHELELWELVK